MAKSKYNEAVLEIIQKSKKPLDALSVIETLKKQDPRLNKTTVYRILDKLVEDNIVNELDFGEGKKRYEISGHHHHHFFCEGCKKIECVEPEKNLCEMESSLSKKTGFSIKKHVFDFFGLCNKCK